MAVTVPCLWPGETVVCLASGPSLTVEDVQAVRGRARVIAVNDALRLAPWADVLYSSDSGWWKRRKGAPEFAGLKYTVAPKPHGRSLYRWSDVQVLSNTGTLGLERDPSGLKTYQNSGGAAINLAVHFGAARILLLGYDMGTGPGGLKHFYGDRGMSSPYSEFRRYIATMVPHLKATGVEVLNASRRTRLECFERVTLEQAIPREVAA